MALRLKYDSRHGAQQILVCYKREDFVVDCPVSDIGSRTTHCVTVSVPRGANEDIVATLGNIELHIRVCPAIVRRPQ